MVYHQMNSSLLLRMIRLGANNLSNHKDIINQLNVFPVPDGDTGTNMNLSMQSGVRALEEVRDSELPVMLKAYVNGLLMGARGNSGVLLSQLFKGFQEALKDHNSVNTKDFAIALDSGVKKAYGAVTNPVEGTILTVAKDAAACAAKAAETNEDLTTMMEEIVAAARTSLAGTPELLPVLKEVGVVDSGGKGLLVIYEGFLAALKDEELQADMDETNIEMQVEQEHDKAVQGFMSADEIEFGYCTEFFVDFTKDKLALHPFDESQFRNQLSEFGNSLLVASTDDFVKVHIHTEQPGKVMTIGQKYGDLMKIDIENMRKQHEALMEAQEETTEKVPASVITFALGSGMKDLLKSIGATAVITGGQTMNPSTEDILKQIDQANADMIYILPNNKNILLAAEQAKQLTEKPVMIIPSKSIPQGIGALFVFDAEAAPEVNEQNMVAAMQGVKTGQVTSATRDTVINGIDIQENAFIAMNDETILAADKDQTVVLKQLIDHLVDVDDEILTVFFGEDVTDEEVDSLKGYLENKLDIEVEYHHGNQPLYPYMLMVE